MRRDEMDLMYKNCMKAMEQAQIYRGSEEEKVQSLESQINQDEKKLFTCKSSRVSLEKRLEDVREIIRTLNTSVETAIADVNRSAGNASGRYAAAVRCSAVASASIQTAYRTKTVQDDSDSADTWQLCRKEEQRLLNGIEELNSRMEKLEATISVLGQEMTNAKQNIQAYTKQIQQCEYTASELRKYRGP